jgi:hypothetical protein
MGSGEQGGAGSSSMVVTDVGRVSSLADLESFDEDGLDTEGSLDGRRSG